MASISSIYTASTHEILWQMPLSLVGHLFAKSLQYNGEKGIERPKNYKEALKELKNKMESKQK